jgi:hypothetical protein
MALRSATFVDVIDETNPSANTKKVHPNIEATMDGQIGNIMQFILTNPSPQIKQDIRRHFSGACGPGPGPGPVPAPTPAPINMPGPGLGPPPAAQRVVRGGAPTSKRQRATRKKITK